MIAAVQAIPWPETLYCCTPSLLLGFALGYWTGRHNHHQGGSR